MIREPPLPSLVIHPLPHMPGPVPLGALAGDRAAGATLASGRHVERSARAMPTVECNL